MQRVLNYLLFVVVLGTVNSLDINFSVDTPETFEKHSFVNTLKECGRETLSSESGAIEYKLSEPLEVNERCVWIIIVPNATQYEFNVSSFGFPEASVDHKLSITKFETRSFPETTIVDNVGLHEFNASMLVVTFHTGNSSGVSNHTGFRLQYSAILDENASNTISWGSADYYNASNPHNGLFFVDYERKQGKEFKLFHWGDPVYKPGQTMNLVYMGKGGWYTNQQLEVFSYNPTDLDRAWDWKDSLIPTDYRTGVILSQEPILFMFRQDGVPLQSAYYGIVNLNCDVN